jgi:hypothetical protein
MLPDKLNTPLVVLTALLWVALTVMGWTGLGYEAMFVGLVLLFVYLVQGMARRGRLRWRLLAFPLVPWLLLWALSFALSRHFADAFAGQRPDFTILGLHPSFAWTVLTYWIGGVLTLSVGFAVRRDDWLSQADWDDFRRRVGADGGAATDGERSDAP